MRRGDRGAAAVEFALVLPILVLLIFGIVDFGRLLRAQITITEAAREAARASALVSDAAATTRSDDVTAGLDDTAGSPTTTVTDSCKTTSDPSDDTSVTVTYQFSFITPVFLVGDGTLEISATSVMPCLR